MSRSRVTSKSRRIVRYMAPAAETPRSRSGDLAELWDDPEMKRLIDFMQFADDDLPTTSFHIRPGELVTDPAGWLQALRIDVAAGPDGPRALTGALQCDLRKLHELFSRNCVAAVTTAVRRPPKPR